MFCPSRITPGAVAAFAVISILSIPFSPAGAEEFALRQGDRVVWLGGAFVERLQASGYLELELSTVLAEKKLTFRNLGWSGDNVFGDARAVFGARKEGFERLQRDLQQARPTVVVVAYGNNEAHGGASQLSEFQDGLRRLLAVVEATKARVVLMGPHNYEAKGPPLPSPAEYNRKLVSYRAAIRSLAEERGHFFLDLNEVIRAERDPSDGTPGLDELTDNGVHFSPYGYWRIAAPLARRLGARRTPWEVTIDLGTGRVSASGGAVAGLDSSSGKVRFRVKDSVLPRPLPPPFSPPGARRFAGRGKLSVRGLAPGRYGLSIDGKKNVAASARQWRQGVLLNRPAGADRVKKARQQIVAKNELYFHRYRPQNETYLFLFRKHEQGNNAVEIPQFEPLVQKSEAKIHQLLKPATHAYQLDKID